jgi:hypothetical protein
LQNSFVSIQSDSQLYGLQRVRILEKRTLCEKVVRMLAETKAQVPAHKFELSDGYICLCIIAVFENSFKAVSFSLFPHAFNEQSRCQFVDEDFPDFLSGPPGKEARVICGHPPECDK